jgi:hypothetical protein
VEKVTVTLKSNKPNWFLFSNSRDITFVQ